VTWPIPERGTLADILPLLQAYHAYEGVGAVGEWIQARVAGPQLGLWAGAT